jgi:eukaryotic-like serine/threonine-protein kinase
MNSNAATGEWAAVANDEAEGGDATARRDTPPAGSLIDGKYRVVRTIGSGGMGIVVLAHDESLDRNVAIKVIRSDYVGSASARRLFSAEARAMARVKHPNVVEIYAYGEHEGSPFFAMQYVRGCDLHEWLERYDDGVVSTDEAIGLLAQICRGVEAMHAVGTIHQDIKPCNVLIGPRFEVAVTDFGLAQFLRAASHEGASMHIGTPPFTAPEVVRGEKISNELAPRVDVYALGVLAYQLLTGCYMFPVEDTQKLFHYQSTFDPKPPSTVRPELPPAFDEAVLAALRREPRERTASPSAFLQSLFDAREITQTRAMIRPLVLVVDDDPSALRLLQTLLRNGISSIDVVTAVNGQEALAAIRQRRPAVVITDLEMPRVNGMELVAALRASNDTSEVPIIVTSSVGSAKDWRVLHQMGANDFLPKPLNPDTLCATVRRYIGRKRLAAR